jgi:hypothetical protein
MLKFRSTDNLEAYISSIGCLVLKQDSTIHGREVTIVLTPDQAVEVAALFAENHEIMSDLWNRGMEAEDDSEA